MSIKIKDSKKKISISISGELTIYTAQEYHKAIIKKFSADKNLDIDLSDVEEVDTSGLQILAAMKKELGSHNSEMNISAMSAVVKDALEMSRLMHDINCNKYEN